MMYFDQEHTAGAVLKDGFYAAEDSATPHGVWVFRVKTQPLDAKKWAGRRVISLAKNPYARTFLAIAVLTPEGKPPFWEIAPTVDAETRARIIEARAKVGPSRMALDNQVYRLEVWRDPAVDASIMAAMRRLLFTDARTTEEAGRMYARKFGRCRICNHKLIHADSVETGIGPECAGTRRHVEVGL